MLLLGAAFAAGIAAGPIVLSGLALPLIICLIAAASAFALRGKAIATVLVTMAFFAAGAFVHQAQEASVSPDRIKSIYDSGTIVSGEPVTLTGTITGGLETAPDGLFIRISVDSLTHGNRDMRASGTLRLFGVADSPEMARDYDGLGLRHGTRVRIACEFAREDGFRNPGGLSRKTMLDWQDLDASGTVKSPLLVEKLSDGRWTLSQSVFGIRSELIAKFRELFHPQTAGVLIASLLGNKHFLDGETAEVFREGGTFHILVISGLHITFIGGIAALVVGWFTRRKGVQFVVVCTFLWLYTIAVGAELPVVRASMMFTVLWFSYVIHRIGSLANALGTCGLLLLAWRPSDLFTPSFQLTFVSVSAIVLAGFPLISNLRRIGEWTPSSTEPFPANVPKWLSRFCETLYWNRKAWEIESARHVWSAMLFKSPFLSVPRPVQRVLAYLFEGVLISLIVQLAMLPLVVHYFHRITPASVPMNLWAGLFITLESFASLFAVLFSYFHEYLAVPFVRLTEAFHWLLVSVPAAFTHHRWLSFRVPVYAGSEPWLYTIYFLFTAVLACSAFRWDPFSLRDNAIIRPRWMLGTAVAMFILGGVITFHPLSEPRPDGRLHVEFLDVGQGDAAFVTFPNGETMLIDAGGRNSYTDENEEPFEPDIPSIGEAVVSEFLWEKGYSRIDHIIATHADADHIQGLTAVVKNFTVSNAWFGLPTAGDDDQLRLMEALARRGVPVRNLVRGDALKIGGVSVEVLHPPLSGAEGMKENDRSIVIRLSFGNRSFLLTGDIEQRAEYDLTSSKLDLRADVVKVPHHGSRTSSTPTFVESVKPLIAVIPVGRRSMFGHPHREVVERWRNAGAGVSTTGECGTISFSTDGNDLVVDSFVRSSE